MRPSSGFRKVSVVPAQATNHWNMMTDNMDIVIVPLKSFAPAQPADNGNRGNGIHNNGAEAEPFLLSNGETSPSLHTMESQNSHNQTSAVCRMKKEMNEVLFWKVRLWMVFIVLLLVLIPIVIVISMAVCSALHEDVDEKYDLTLFGIPLHFNGSFQMTNDIFTEELLSPSSNQSKTLAAALQEKLAGVYSASHALGRYFSKADISSFRNGSVIAEYGLEFRMPREHGELRNFTLSREIVYNVLRQFLYDQETEDPLHINPASLSMS